MSNEQLKIEEEEKKLVAALKALEDAKYKMLEVLGKRGK